MTATLGHVDAMGGVIRRLFGIVTVRIPSFSSAETRSTAIASGSENAREKRPWPRSTR